MKYGFIFSIYLIFLSLIYIIPRLLLLIPNITKVIKKSHFKGGSILARIVVLFASTQIFPYISNYFVEDGGRWLVFFVLISIIFIVVDMFFGNTDYIDAEYKKSSK